MIATSGVRPPAEHGLPWRQALPEETELVTSELAQLEIARTLLRAGIDHQRVPYITGQALRGVYPNDLTSTSARATR